MPEPEIVRGDLECRYKSLQARVAPSVDPSSEIDVTCFMTTDSVDADDEVVLPAGADLSRFDKNPVLMLCHGYGQPGCYYPLPVGRAVWTKKRPHGVMAGLQFARTTAMGQEVKALFDEDMVRSFSIGFLSLESSPMTKEEANSRPDWKAAYARTGGRILVHRKWSLLELSVAPVPSNEDALRAKYAAKGIALPAWLILEKPEAKMDDDRQIRAGDWVRVDAPHFRGCGFVKSIHDGETVPDVDVQPSVAGSSDDPVARVKCYKPMGNGHVLTQRHVGAYCKHFEKIPPLDYPSRPSDQDKGSASTANVMPLGDAGNDDQQISEKQIAKIMEQFRPELILKTVATAIREGCRRFNIP